MKCRMSIADCRMGLVLAALFVFAACQPVDETREVSLEPYAVRVTLSTNRLAVGDPVRVRVDVTHPAGARVELPDPAHSDSIMVRERQTAIQPVTDELVQSTYRYAVTSFQVGEHAIATGTVRFVMAGMDPVEREFPTATLEVVSLLDDDTGLSPIKPLLTWPGRLPRWIGVLLGVALLALLLGLIAARMRNQPHEAKPGLPPPPPHETALEALRNLLARRYIENGEVDAFYVELSAIVRRYLEDRFELRAPESTTEEFIRDAANARVLSPDHQGLVRDFLEQSDLVKFARFRPEATDMQAAFSAGEGLVHETTPAPDQKGAAS